MKSRRTDATVPALVSAVNASVALSQTDAVMAEIVAPIVADVGWAIQYAGGRGPFAYTVGLPAKGVPELYLAAPLDLYTLFSILNAVARTFITLGSADAGEMYAILQTLPVQIREIDPADFSLYAGVAVTWAHRTGVPIQRAMQVVLPDATGRFPGEVRYDWIEQTLLSGAALAE
jgi:hypothetical protein